MVDLRVHLELGEQPRDLFRFEPLIAEVRGDEHQHAVARVQDVQHGGRATRLFDLPAVVRWRHEAFHDTRGNGVHCREKVLDL